MWRRSHTFPGLGGEQAEARRVWTFRLTQGEDEYEVRSAELEGEEHQDVQLTLGTPDQRRLGLDVLHSQGGSASRTRAPRTSP